MGPLALQVRLIETPRLVYILIDVLQPGSNSRQQNLHLPPIQVGDNKIDNFYPVSATAQLNAVFGREARSPRIPRSQHHDTASGRDPGPKFRRVTHPSDLEPRVNAQPPFRRANP